MMSNFEFENLLNRPESSTLDFKRTNYNLTNDIDKDTTSKFVKDIISFANTIRTESAYIILGVGVRPDNTKELIGIDGSIDEAILQDKVKDKVFPRPIFKLNYIKYNDLVFGIIEIPIYKYSLPISPTIKHKGLEVGKVYFRRGSSNTEALGVEIIHINDWLKSLPEVNKSNSLHDQITKFIKRLTKGDEKLSVIITDVLYAARNNNISELIDFCSMELVGINTNSSDTNSDEFEYRVVKAKISIDKIEINPYSFVKATQSMIQKEMDDHKNFYDLRLLFTKPLNEIEEYISSFNENTICSTMTTNSKNLLPNGGDYPVHIYIFKDSFTSLYRNIRQKTIDKLMRVN